MSSVTTTRPIDLGQLAQSPLVGGSVETPAPLSMMNTGDERTITSHDEAITQAQLEAAIEAHVPEPPPPSAEEVIAQLQQQVAEQAAAIEEQYAVQDEIITMILGG